MKKNGYLEVVVEKDFEDINKGDKVLVSSSEYGQLPKDAIVTCYTKDKKEVMIQKSILKIESEK